MTEPTETFHDKLIRHAQELELLLANPEVMDWFSTTLRAGRERNGLVWDFQELDNQTRAFVTEIMFGQLFVREPANGSLVMEVNSEKNGQPTHNSRYIISLSESNNRRDIESKVIDLQHDSLVPIAQLDYWLAQLVGLLTERKTPEVVKL